MNAALHAAALALVGSLPAAALAWGAAMVTERITRDPGTRERAWELAFWLPALAVLAAAVVAVALPLTPEAPRSATPGDARVAVQFWIEAVEARPRGFDFGRLTPWVIGASALGLAFRLARAAAGARRMAGLVARAEPLENAGVSARIASTAARMGAAMPPVLVSAETTQPVLAGVRRPAIVLPRAMVAEASVQQLALVCAHELAHLRRRDNLRLLGEAAALGAFWFNPLMGRLAAGLRAAREEARAARALAAEPPETRRLYADTLVQALRLRAGPELQSALTGAHRRTAMRLTALLHPAPPPRLRHRLLAGGLLSALLLAGGGGAVALAQAGRDAAPSPSPNGTHRFGLHVTPEPGFLKQWGLAQRRSGLREAGDLYTGELKLAGPAPADYPVTVDGRAVPPGQDMAAIGPVASVQVRRTATTPFGPKPRITRVDIRGSAPNTPPEPESRTAPPPVAGSAPPVITRPNWAARPSGEDLERLYPAAARAAGLSGRATIQCSVTASGTLTGCAVVSEAPDGAGFGLATLALSDRFRMRPQLQDGSPVEGGVVRVPVLWQVSTDQSSPATQAPRTSRETLSGIPQTSPEAFTVVADRFVHRPGPPPSAVYLGDVAVRGRLRTDGAPVYVNGRLAGPGLDLASLGKIDRMEMTFTAVNAASPERQKPTEIRITTAR